MVAIKFLYGTFKNILKEREMKKVIFLFLASIVLFAGCTIAGPRNDDADKNGALVLSLDSSTVENRTIVPTISMDVATYDVSGSGPDGASFNLLGETSSSITVLDLKVGTWVITVNAKNSTGTIIGSGSASVDVLASSVVTVEVTVTPLDGQGTALLTVDWSGAEQFTGAAVISGTLELKTATGYDPAIAMSFSITGQIATYGSTLDTGYYRLLIQLSEGGVNAFVAETLRIVYNEETSADIIITDIPNTGDIIIDIINDLQNPIAISFGGVVPDLELGTNMTVTATTVPSPVDAYEWYLDGQLLAGTTSSITFGSTLEARTAVYTLTLIVSLDSILSSKYVTFIVSEEPIIPPELLDDFEDGNDTNLWNGINGAMDDFGVLTMTYDPANGYNGSVNAMALDYDVSVLDSWSGVFMTLSPPEPSADLTVYENLTLYVKGSVANIPFKIGLANTSALSTGRNSAKVYINDYLDGGVTTSYQKVTIPLDAFANLDSLVEATVLTVVFENTYATSSGFPTSGILYVDDVGFDTVEPTAVRIDHFGDNFGPNALGANIGDMNGAGATHSSSFTNVDFHNYTYALQSVYNTGATDWCGMWFIFGGGDDGAGPIEDGFTAMPSDFSSYTKITLWIRGDSAGTTPAKIKLELSDGAGHNAYIPDNSTTPGTPISTTWTKYEVPLSAFSGGLNTASIQQFNFVYEGSQVGNTSGITYFDEIQFEK